MEHTNLVASELNSSGFKTRVIGQVVEASLDTRKVNNMEVRAALENIFEDVSFKLHSVASGILVEVE